MIDSSGGYSEVFKPIKMDYTINKLNKKSPKQTKALIYLLNEAFDKSPEYFEWKHNLSEAYEIEEYSYCIFHENKCIATLQAIVDGFHCNGTNYRYALIADGVTDGGYRRLGLFEKLIEYALEDLKDYKVEFILGFGNKISRQTLVKKLGYRDFSQMFNARFKIRFNGIASVINPINQFFFRLKYSLNKTPVIVLDTNSYLDNYNHLVSNFDTYFFKDRRSLEWRISKPGSNFKAFGATSKEVCEALALVNFLGDLLYIEDFIFKKGTPESAQRLISYIKSEAYKIGAVNRILFSHSSDENFQRLFSGEGFKVTISDKSVLYKPSSESILQPNIEDLHFTRIHKNE